MMGLVCQRAVQGDEIALSEQGIQIHVVDALRRVHIVGDDLHTESPADIDEHSSDPSGTYHAHSLSVQIHAGQSVQAEIKLTGPVVGLVGLPVQGQQKGHGVLCHRVGRVSRYADCLQIAQSLQVQVVVSGAAHGHQLYTQLLKLLQNLPIDGIVYKRAHHIAALGRIYGLGIQLMLHVTNLNIIGAPLFKCFYLIGFCVEKCHFDHCIFLLIPPGSALLSSLPPTAALRFPAALFIVYRFCFCYTNKITGGFSFCKILLIIF